ncbi:DNA polymerase III subunit beta [Candidatus Nomurabacteria bacterium]|nr:DNA polymerase III subunit beta [Candidatus Nomurabacteria bacterium]
MQFSCNQDTFAKYLNVVSRIVNTKPGLPILNNVLFETSNGKLMMTATDLEISLNCWIGAEIKAEGKVTVPAKQLSEFVNSIPSEKVDVVFDKKTVKVSTLNNSAEFNIIPPDDYPSIVSVNGEKPLLKLPKEDLLTAINRVVFSAATDDIKPVMTGIKLEISKDTISFVGSDGLRLSRQSMKLLEPISNPVDLLVPAKAMEELAYIVSEFSSENSNNTVDLYFVEDRNQVIFRYNDIDLISRLIDGQYPAYQQVIPTGYQTKSDIKKTEFQNALRVVNIIARGVLGSKLFVDQNPKDNVITLSATQSEVGSNESSFAATIEGEEIKMAFSAKLLSDMLSHIGAEDIVFESSSPTSAGVFKIKGDDSFLHLIMPMRL